MRKLGFCLLVLGLVIAARLSHAGDVVYTIWEDDGNQFWVRIQNDTDRTIKVESILIVFYNGKGKPVDQQTIPCKGRCSLPSGDIRDFGPFGAPPNTESARVRNVKYAVE